MSQFNEILQREDADLGVVRRLYSRYPKHCINKDTGEVTVIAPSESNSSSEAKEGEEEEVHLEFGYDETTTFDPIDLLCEEGAEADLRHLASAMATKRGSILRSPNVGAAEKSVRLMAVFLGRRISVVSLPHNQEEESAAEGIDVVIAGLR